MELSVLTLRVVLLFFPGVLCALIVHALTIQRERTTPQFLTSAFVYGVSTYLLLAGLRELSAGGAKMLSWGPPPRVTFFSVLTDEKARIAWGEIGFSALVAVLLALGVSAALNNNLLHGAAERVGISRRFGQIDVWGYFFNSPQILWVAVRDLATDTLYEGWVEAFSDTGASPELLLRQVTVSRNSTGSKLSIASAYIWRETRRRSSSSNCEEVAPCMIPFRRCAPASTRADATRSLPRPGLFTGRGRWVFPYGWCSSPNLRLRPSPDGPPLLVEMRTPVAPLQPGKYNKGGRNPEPSTPRPANPPPPMGLPGWVMQSPQPPQFPRIPDSQR